jgi:uncharacterized membrane protein
MPGWIAVAFWGLAFSASHLVLSSAPVRTPLVRRLGERAFLGVYSLVALATFVPWVRSWWSARGTGPWLWALRDLPGVRELALVLALFGAIFVFLGLLQPSPTGMAPGAALRPHGVTRITRHALFTGFGLWGVAHCLVNGGAADLLFFGGIALFALVGAMHQDARKRASQPAFQAETSLLPFVAILAGRQKLALGELSWLAVALGAAAGVGLYLAHDAWFR